MREMLRKKEDKGKTTTNTYKRKSVGIENQENKQHEHVLDKERRNRDNQEHILELERQIKEYQKKEKARESRQKYDQKVKMKL